MDPLISVIIPTFNRAHLLRRAVKSVLNQTYARFEVIIINDGSSDDTKEVISQFDDERIRYKNQKNKGVSAARNKGIMLARGEYIAFLDDDDEWFPRKLERQVHAFARAPKKVGLVYTGFKFKIFDSSMLPPNFLLTRNGNVHRHLFSIDSCAIPSIIMVRKSCFEKCGKFNENLLAGEDRDFGFRLSSMFWFKYIPEVLVIKYEMPGSLSRDRVKSATADQYLLREYRDKYKRFARQKGALTYFKLAKFWMSQNNSKEAERCFKQTTAMLYVK